MKYQCDIDTFNMTEYSLTDCEKGDKKGDRKNQVINMSHLLTAKCNCSIRRKSGNERLSLR